MSLNGQGSRGFYEYQYSYETSTGTTRPSPAPSLPPQSVAQLVYANGHPEPAYGFLQLANGRCQITRETWRLLQLLQRAGSRFV